MTTKIGNFSITFPAGCEAAVNGQFLPGNISLFTFRFAWDQACRNEDGHFTVRWRFPAVDTLYFWSPRTGHDHSVKPEWLLPKENSMISSGAPVQALFNGRGISRYVWQLSECRMLCFLHTGICEEDGCVEAVFEFGTAQFTNCLSTDITLRIDTRPLPLYTALKEAASWWADDLQMTPAFVPADAYDPCYSFWYSFHQAVYEEEVEAECRRAKSLGFSTCIIDDGWQTDDNSRGYAFCGDWQPASSKIRDMAAHVKRVHDIGMKYILWYSVPLIGYQSEHYQEYKGMLLKDDPHLNCSVLDPRYKKVREHLQGIYLKALKEWDLDGFKLDFIDRWCYAPDNAPYAPGMDIPSLEEAAAVFMQELITALKQEKPDILLEFRQGYIGPHMREYGNMFRVGDCPDDYIANRAGIFDLRMMMGASAVHSDMLMWHKDETPENAALQLISVLFGVIQYSARLSQQTENMLKMSRFWLDFARQHKGTLLADTLQVFEPQLLYTWAQAFSEKETVAAVYAADKCICPEVRDTIYVANGAQSERILLELTGSFRVTVKNCLGENVSEEDRSFSGITALAVPVGGLVTLVQN